MSSSRTPPQPPQSKLYSDRPAFIYGTAWKKTETTRLVKTALLAGFRHIDTAAQPKHYQESLVGDALREAYAEGLVTREDVYVQTKFTAPGGQDLNDMPYDLSAPLEEQIRTSIATSLRNLRHDNESEGTAYLDCVLLHSPLPTIPLTLEAWRILETYVPNQIHSLGISNVSLPTLRTLYDTSTIKPAVVQNRFYPATRFDVPLRAYCTERGILYQSFWTLTGNPGLLRCKAVVKLARAAEVSPPVALYALVRELGPVVLNGTTSEAHMKEDLEGVERVRQWAEERRREWVEVVEAFRRVVEGAGLS